MLFYPANLYWGELVAIAIACGIVALVVRAVIHNRDRSPREPGSAVVRRLFQYLILLGGLTLTATGLSELIDYLRPVSRVIVARGHGQLALALTFLIVGGSLYYVLGTRTLRRLDDPDERGSLGFGFYMMAAQITGLVFTARALIQVVGWLFKTVPVFNWFNLIQGCVWGAVWVSHWMIAERFIRPPRGQAHQVIGSAIGLIFSAQALGLVLIVLVDAVYRNWADVGFGVATGRLVRIYLPQLIVGAAIWWFYWLRRTQRAGRTPIWNGYVVIFGLVNGMAAAVLAGVVLANSVLAWFFGTSRSDSAVMHFRGTPSLVVIALIAIAVFVYHRGVMLEHTDGGRSEVRRMIDYLVAGVGAVATAGGIMMLIIVLIRQGLPATLVAGGTTKGTLVRAIALLVVGVPVWLVPWLRAQRFRSAEPDAEPASLSRQVYEYTVIGVAASVAFVTIVLAMTTVLRSLFDGVFGSLVIARSTTVLALLGTALLVGSYHVVVLREDRRALAARPAPPVGEVVLLGASTDFAAALAEGLGVRVRMWDRLDGVMETGGADEAIENLRAEAADRVLLIASESGHTVIPFTPRQ